MPDTANRPGAKSLPSRHHFIPPTSSVPASLFSTGGTRVGSHWKGMQSDCTRDQAFDLLDKYHDLGGNFIDAATAQDNSESEQWIGEWMAETGRRPEMVISSKFSMNSAVTATQQSHNKTTTGTASMLSAVDRTLKNLQTQYIDLYYVHYWDFATHIPELMQSLDTLVNQGKVMYLGISDAPAWFVTKSNAYAREHGLCPFSVYQGRYSSQMRDLERDIISTCRNEGMAIHLWGDLGREHIRGPSPPSRSPVLARKENRETPFVITSREQTETAIIQSVAKRRNIPVNSVALAYALQKAPYKFPTAEVEAFSMKLTPEDVAEIDRGYAIISKS